MAIFIINEANMARLTGPGGLVDQAARRASGHVRDDARRIITEEQRVDTGAMRQSVESHVIEYGSRSVSYRIGSRIPYARFQHDGVGPFGPRRAKVLRFRPKGSSVFIFAAHVKGFPGIHFLTRALHELRKSDFGKL